MSSKWPVMALGDLLEPIETIDPTRISGQSWQYVDVSSVSNVSCSIVGSTTISAKTAPSRARRLIRAGDVLFATVRPTLKRVALVGESFNEQICSTGYFVARCKPELLNSFLFHYLQSKAVMDYFGGLEKGTSYPAISDSEFKSTQIPLPPLDEQRRIVAKLDQALGYVDELSQQNTRQIIDAKDLQDAFNSELFEQIHTSTKSTTLGEVAEKVVVGFVGTCAPFYTPDGVPFLRTQNVTKSGIDVSQFQRISRDFHLANKKSQLLEGDVLLSRVITNDVNVGIVPPELGEANCANVVIVRPGKNLLPKFLSAYITTQKAQRYLLDRKVGSAQVVVNTGVVKDWPIVAPSIDEQAQIVRKLDEFLDLNRSRIRVLQGISDNLVSLRSSILSAAFAGDL